MRSPLLAAFAAAALLAGSLVPQAAEPAAPGSPASPAIPAPKLSDYAGKWTGKWDGIWAVQFTVSGSPTNDSVAVVYEWEENPGRPLHRQKLAGTLVDGGLKVGPRILVSLDPKDPNRASAVGKFAEQRKAELKREWK